MDLIERQKAIDALDALCDRECEYSKQQRSFMCGACRLGSAFDVIDELPSAQPEPCDDAVSRRRLLSDMKELIAAWEKYPVMAEQIKGVEVAIGYVELIPSAQPERTCVNCGRTANNGGWYADGGTRCPIEEHYALPKDGYCHLWEKRNVTDDDYTERREE